MKILAIGAHFDDVEIGCGGTLLRRADEGDEIFILVVTDSAYSRPNGGPERPAAVAKAEAQEAANVIGAELICLNKESLNLIHNEELAYDIEDVVNEVKPDILLTHWGGDFHSDHVAVSLSSLRASRRTPTILSYRSNWYETEQVFNGAYYIDISKYFEKKIEMIRIYKSVLEPVNYSWIDFIRTQNTYEGMKVGVGAAECFNCIKHFE